MGFFATIPPPFGHQARGTKFQLENDRVYDASDPGTGKTRKALDTIAARRQKGGGKTLVLAPKSILEPSWAEDAKLFTPELRTSVAYAANRRKAFEANADIYVTNHDATKWLVENSGVLEGFTTVIGDEFTAYKHRTSARSKALAKIIKRFPNRIAMSGTPNPQGVLDLWHQYYLLDDGERLGTSFWKFRQAVCEPEQVGPGANHVQWKDKEGAIEAVWDLISDITIRDKLEDCIDIPENSKHFVRFDLTPAHMKFYEKMRDEALLECEDGDVSAIHAGSVATKLLQIASGAVYNDESVTKVVATERYELVMSLIEQREQCVVAFNWKHQKEQLLRLANKKNISFGIIDGTTKDKERLQIVKNFQAGRLKTIFAQPQSASHGLTLTAGTTVIWPSPPAAGSERFIQFNHRIYRASQTRKTETIMICANDTREDLVYQNLQSNLDQMSNLQTLLTLPPVENAA